MLVSEAVATADQLQTSARKDVLPFDRNYDIKKDSGAGRVVSGEFKTTGNRGQKADFGELSRAEVGSWKTKARVGSRRTPHPASPQRGERLCFFSRVKW
jgi:hypothetical protein